MMKTTLKCEICGYESKQLFQHLKSKHGKLRERDIVRQREIEDFLKCKFIRIKYEKK